MRELQGLVLVEGREDHAALLEYDEGIVAVVADGAGGTGGGAEAARGVIEVVRHLGWQREPERWTELLGRLDHAVESVRYPSGTLLDDVAVVVCRVGAGEPEGPP